MYFIIIIIYEHLYRIKTFSTSYKIIKNTAINGGPVTDSAFAVCEMLQLSVTKKRARVKGFARNSMSIRQTPCCQTY